MLSTNFLFICYNLNNFRRSYDESLDLIWIKDIYFVDSLNGWMVGNSPKIFKTIDGGTTWQSVWTGIDGLKQIYFISELVGWIVSNEGNLYATLDGGISWIQKSTSFQISKIWFVNQTLGWAIEDTLYSFLYRTNDSGLTWDIQKTFPKIFGDLGFKDLYFINETHGFVLYRGFNGTHRLNTLYSTNTSGNSWSIDLIVNDHYLKSFFFSNISYCWVIGSDGSIFHSNDSGKTWYNQTLSNPKNLKNLYFINSTHGWICGYETTLIQTSNSGLSWENNTTFNSTECNLDDVYFKNEFTGFIGGDIQCKKTNDGGISWRICNLNPFEISYLWIWYLLIFNILFSIFSFVLFFSLKLFKKFNFNRNISIDHLRNEILYPKTIWNKFGVGLSFGLCFYGIYMGFIWTHEISHALSIFIVGGYVTSLHISLEGTGLTNFVYNNDLTSRIFVNFSGIIGTLLIGLIIGLLTYFYAKKNKGVIIGYLSAFIFSLGIFFSFGYFFIDPLINLAGDATQISNVLGWNPLVISILILPLLILGIIISIKMFYTINKMQDSKEFEFEKIIFISVGIIICMLIVLYIIPGNFLIISIV